MTKKFEKALTEVLAGANPDAIPDEVLAEVVGEKTQDVEQQVEEKKPTISALIAELVFDAGRTYLEIVNEVLKTFPDAKTSTRSMASVAARLRKTGVDVPHRRNGKGGAEA